MAERQRIALVTAAEHLARDSDMPLLQAALAAVGIDSDTPVWDDPAVAWDRYALAVVRSTWDYCPRRDAFVAWAERVAAVTRLANPAAILRWNSDKRYLRELAGAGVPIVPTTFVAPGERPAIPYDGDVVVKPAVSAGAADSARHAAGDPAARAHVDALLAAGRVVMIQPYLRAIDAAGESDLVYFAGAFSHGVRKGAILTSGTKGEETSAARAPTGAERALADRVLAAVPGGAASLLYARVDLAPTDAGPVLMELELTEPFLFLSLAGGAAARLAQAIARTLALAPPPSGRAPRP